MSSSATALRIRRMSAADLERVLEIARSLHQAPHWPVAAYAAAMNPENTPRRIALVAEWAREKGQDSSEGPEKQASGAEQAAEMLSALKGHGFSRAAGEPNDDGALAAEGMQVAENAFPQGLKPNLPLRASVGAAKAAPFQDSMRVVGFAMAALLAPEAELETIAVAADGQRRGIGGLLLRALAEGLRTEHIRDLILEVRASNRTALGFYKAQGFEETGRRLRYYADPEEDAVLMRLKLA